jgi:hypothetical protein
MPASNKPKKLTVAEVADRIAALDDLFLRELLTDLYQRSTAQATLLRTLRDGIRESDVVEVEPTGRNTVSGNRVKSGKRTPPSDTPGVFMPVPYCLGCGKDKEPHQRTIMCTPCNRARQVALHEGDNIVRYTSCGNCGKKVNGTSTPLCGKCQVSYRKWRDRLGR